MKKTFLTGDDLYLFNEGTHSRLYEKLGAHATKEGTHFAVWAPSAGQVTIIGDFNGWNKTSHPLKPQGSSGIWAGVVDKIGIGTPYKYHIVSRSGNYAVDKADPFAFHAEAPPRTASIVWNLDYDWHDANWMKTRGQKTGHDKPMSIYEVHLGSWRRPVGAYGHTPLQYRELAQQLAEYVSQMGFTHVEFLPVMEHPFYGSWGYQTTGYFAPTSRYGTPQDFMFLIDTLHRHNIGVILDWVPSHFPADEHGLSYFDGTHLYEHADPRQGFHPDWRSSIFNYGRHEVAAFLFSSALFWLDKYHADGLRVDAVASMLYLDYSRSVGEWIPNKFGGRENLEAIGFLKKLNEEVYKNHPDVFTVAEESTAWPMVSKPTDIGGLGFGFKWDMGWMHDTLDYLQHDPIHRKYHHDRITFRMIYAFHENFVLPLSHDEVVHGKGSLAGKMPGDDWQKFANLRLLLGYMYAGPGKKLLFMGGEFGQWNEWNHEASLDWHLLEFPFHAGLSRWVKDLNRIYRNEKALYEQDHDPAGFEWVDGSDSEQSVLSFLRWDHSRQEALLVILNFTPLPRMGYRVGLPMGGLWRETANSDAADYGGSGVGNLGRIEAEEIPAHGRPFSLALTLPPLGVVFLKREK